MKNKSFYSQLPKEIMLLFAGEKLRNYFFEKDFSRIEAPTFEISQKDIEEYKKSVSKVNFWHGTGKFKYENSQIQDILTPVFEDGLKTHEDKYLSILSNDLIMHSISLVKSREIARCYADIHRVENSKKPAYRAGNSAFWLSKYYAKMHFTMYTKYFFVGAVRVWGWRRRVKTNSKNSWSSKVNKKGRTTWDAFHKFSDIGGNFPVILGISKLEKTAKLPKMFSEVEVRSLENISIFDICHIEVPYEKVEEVRDILRHKNLAHISVFPIEIGEKILFELLRK